MKTLVVVGAGPKAAAIAAKAQVLKDQGYPEIRVVVIEKKINANHWRGPEGFTDGKCKLSTPPEKDVGFPYISEYGTLVDRAMLAYSWQSFKLEPNQTGYGDYVDRGRQNPTHEEWARYIDWVISSTTDPAAWVRGEVVRVEPEAGKLLINTTNSRNDLIHADGIVFTGPGPAKLVDIMPSSTDIFDGKNYWNNIDKFENLPNGTRFKIALIGSGETAASIALSLVDLMTAKKDLNLEIEIISPHGMIFTRGESYRENRIFTNPKEWKTVDPVSRQEIISRTDRGVFSVASQMRLNQAESLEVISGRVAGIKFSGSGPKLELDIKRGDPPVSDPREYDKVIIAKGFNAFDFLRLFPANVQPAFGTDSERRALELSVDKHLRISFKSARERPEPEPDVHMPMIAGLAQGPGYPNLSCLGHVADAILSKYIPPRQRP